MKQYCVLHILTRLVKGGADENTLLTIEGLICNNYRVDLVVGGDSDLSLVEELKDLNIIIIPELRRDIKFSNLIALWKLYRLIVRNKYYVVHTHTAMAGFLGRVAARLARTPIVIHSLHGITFHKNLNTARKKLYVYLEMLTGHWTDYFITVGEDVKQKYLSIPIGTKEKYFTVRSGFDFEKFSAARDNEEDFRNLLRKEFKLSQRDVLIGMVSRIEPRKGHIYLLEAAKVVIKTHPQSKFLIIGEGYYKEKLMHEVKKADCENSFVFTGHRSDVERMMASLDIFVLTSLWEGLPRVLVQAALLGKPIVTFDVEGAREVVKENVNGFIVPTKDVQLLAVRLIQLIDDLDSARRIGKRGMELVDGFWDKNVMVKQTVNIYNEIIFKKANGSQYYPTDLKCNFDNTQISNDI